MSSIRPSLAGQEVDGPDAAGGDAPDLLGDLVVDVGGGHHRLGAFDAGLVLQAAEDSPLASVQLAVETGVHSKTSWRRTVEGCEVPRLFAKTRGFSSFSASTAWGYAWLRTSRRATPSVYSNISRIPSDQSDSGMTSTGSASGSSLYAPLPAVG